MTALRNCMTSWSHAGERNQKKDPHSNTCRTLSMTSTLLPRASMRCILRIHESNKSNKWTDTQKDMRYCRTKSLAKLNDTWMQHMVKMGYTLPVSGPIHGFYGYITTNCSSSLISYGESQTTLDDCNSW